MRALDKAPHAPVTHTRSPFGFDKTLRGIDKNLRGGKAVGKSQDWPPRSVLTAPVNMSPLFFPEKVWNFLGSYPEVIRKFPGSHRSVCEHLPTAIRTRSANLNALRNMRFSRLPVSKSLENLSVPSVFQDFITVTCPICFKLLGFATRG